MPNSNQTNVVLPFRVVVLGNILNNEGTRSVRVLLRAPQVRWLQNALPEHALLVPSSGFHGDILAPANALVWAFAQK